MRTKHILFAELVNCHIFIKNTSLQQSVTHYYNFWRIIVSCLCQLTDGLNYSIKNNNIFFYEKCMNNINMFYNYANFFERIFVKTFLFFFAVVVYLFYMALIKGFEREETFLLLYDSLCQLGSGTSI